MSRTQEEANRAIGRIRAMPYGLARTEVAEQESRRIETEGPQEALAYALFALVESYVWGGEGEKAYVPFRRSIRLWDSSPELFDEGDRHDFFWSFKWMVTGLVEHPEIPASQITATIADMERRFAVAGNGMDAVAYASFRWAEHTGDPGVEVAFRAWAATPRDEFSQCEACELGDQAVHLVATGRREEAVHVIENVPPTTRWCATEPADMLSVLALAELDLGHPDRALLAHRRAVAALATAESDMVGARGRRLELLARGGAVEAAHQALADDGHLMLDADSPLGRLRFLTAVVRALSALATLPGAAESDRTVVVPGVPAPTASELRTWAHARALELAAAFDARNGNDHQVAAVDRALAATAAARGIDLAVIDTAALGDASAAPAVVAPGAGTPLVPAASPPGVDPAAGSSTTSDEDVDALLAEADDLAAREELTEAVARYQHAASALDAQGLLARAGGAWAEAARCADLLHDGAGAAAAYRAAVARLVAGGAPADLLTQVVVAWAPVAARHGAAQEVVARALRTRADLVVGAEAERPDVAPALRERQRALARRSIADLDDTAARLLAEHPGALDDGATDEPRPDAVSLAVRAAEAYAALGAVADAAHAFWLAGRVQRRDGALEDAVRSLESATEGFEIARATRFRTEAAGELVELLRETGQDERARAVAARLSS